MKNIVFVFLVLAWLGLTNCTKNDLVPSPQSSYGPPVVPPTLARTAPMAIAGGNQLIYAPTDRVVLRGHALDAENNIKSFAWRQEAGPTVAVIHTPSDSATLVTNLKPGVYDFELTVTDSTGMVGSSVATVYVEAEFKPEKEFLFEYRTWIFPWYATLEIPNIHTHVPEGARLKVYVKRASDPAWKEVTPGYYQITGAKYEYSIEKRPAGAGMYQYGSLYIYYYGNDTDDSPTVKIQY